MPIVSFLADQCKRFRNYFFEKFERFGYLLHRISLKFKLERIFLLKFILKILNAQLKVIFLKNLPEDLLSSKEEKYLFLSEYPSLRRPRDIWIKEEFTNSIFFYSPHSPHIYSKDLDKEYHDKVKINYEKKSFLLLGHPGDYSFINDGKELADPSLEQIFIGHPKYSDKWLSQLKHKAEDFRSKYQSRKDLNILVLSRGYGSYLDEDSHINLIETTFEVIDELIPNCNIFVKKHPRESPSHWDEITKKFSSVSVVNDHILQLATKADFVISYWGSGAMDCCSLGVPVIEYWNPDKQSKDQIRESNSFTTIYRKLGIVFPANDKKELKQEITSMIENECKSIPENHHPFFQELIYRSNHWSNSIEKILKAHGLIDN